MNTDPPQRRIFRRHVVAAAIVIVSLLLWLIPSDVPRLIITERDVLLGRYSVAWLTALSILSGLSWITAAVLLSPSVAKLTPKRIGFAIVAIAVGVIPSIALADFVLRAMRTPRYIERSVRQTQSWPGVRVTGILRHRPRNQQYQVIYVDRPKKVRSYPDAPPGFGTVKVGLTTDDRGYRNQTLLEKYDMIALGDSFVEGSRVDDMEPWPVRLAERSGMTVYNLGISSGHPEYYLNAMQAYGLALSPRIVICMIYEGNDFKARRSGQRAARRSFVKRLKNSPIRTRLKDAMINALGPINADAPVRPNAVLSWMPAAVKAADGTSYYAFTPKRLTRLYWPWDKFAESSGWRHVAAVLKQLKNDCSVKDIRLVIAYAPSKPHVIMPLLADVVDAEALHMFASYKKRNLPPPDAFKEEFFACLDAQEKQLAAFCRDEGIDFISPTAALRDAMAAGRQVYYTYDQHWTALGHAVVAGEINHFLNPPEKP